MNFGGNPADQLQRKMQSVTSKASMGGKSRQSTELVVISRKRGQLVFAQQMSLARVDHCDATAASAVH